MGHVKADIERLKKIEPGSRALRHSFGFSVRCLFKMDFAEAEYIAKLRSG